ncbi:MAG: DUF2070 family protein, partial [Candidatus Odinarchaeia archaeon]
MSSEEIKSEVEKAPALYSVLFQFPSFKKLILISFVTSFIIALIPELIINYFNPYAIYYGFIDGLLVFFLPIVLASSLNYWMIMKTTPMLNLRRLIAASIIDTFILWLFYLVASIISVILNAPLIVIYGFIIGISISFAFRLLMFFSLSFSNIFVNFIVSLTKPVLNITFVFAAYNTPLSNLFYSTYFWIPEAIISIVIMSVGIFTYKSLVDKKLKDKIGIESTVFLRAFMASWLEDETKHIEELFTKLGSDKDVEVSVVNFSTDSGDLAFIIPLIHPGPFRQVGSSNLPYIISQKLFNERKILASVFHGPSTHAENLASSKDCKLIAEAVKEQLTSCDKKFNNASEFIRVEDEDFNVGCQIFGELVLITAFAKKDTEDIHPIVIGKIRELVKPMGLMDVVLIDCHNNKKPNSTRQPIAKTDEVNKLVNLCLECIKKAINMPKYDFSIGGYHYLFSKDLKAKGLGDNGIIATVIKVGNQKIAYILIDGNNMVSGLREDIRNLILNKGFTECE